MLIGLVKKNAIMMIDVALDVERNQGKKPVEAIYEACILRFRPIMMTTMAALLGGLPLALGEWYWIGIAPAAGHHDRGRADREPDADPVYDAGGLCISGSASICSCAAERMKRCQTHPLRALRHLIRRTESSVQAHGIKQRCTT